VEVAADERSLRRARRFLWAFRLIFYPGAAIIAILLLAGRSAGAENWKELRGHTGQGRVFTVFVDEDNRPQQIVTQIAARCPNNGWWYMLNWHAVSRTRIAFDEDTGKLAASYEFRGRWSNGEEANADAHLRGQVQDDTVTGTLWLADRRGSYFCASGVVSFSAG
jgi:hypothetical protein